MDKLYNILYVSYNHGSLAKLPYIYISKHEHLTFNIPIYNPLPSNLPSNSWTMEESQCQFEVIICCKFIALQFALLNLIFCTLNKVGSKPGNSPAITG